LAKDLYITHKRAINMAKGPKKPKKVITEDGMIDPKVLIEHFDEIKAQGGLEISLDPETRAVYEKQQYTLESHLAAKRVGLIEKGKHYVFLIYPETKDTHHFYLDVQIQNGGLEKGHLEQIVGVLNEYDVASVQVAKVVHVDNQPRGLRVINEYVNGKKLHDLNRLEIKKDDWLHVKATGHNKDEVEEAYELVRSMRECLRSNDLID